MRSMHADCIYKSSHAITTAYRCAKACGKIQQDETPINQLPASILPYKIPIDKQTFITCYIRTPGRPRSWKLIQPLNSNIAKPLEKYNYMTIINISESMDNCDTLQQFFDNQPTQLQTILALPMTQAAVALYLPQTLFSVLIKKMYYVVNEK